MDYYTTIAADSFLLKKVKQGKKELVIKEQTVMVGQSGFCQKKLENFISYEQAYHQLIADLNCSAGTQHEHCIKRNSR
ncbi:MAG: hypothetical protein WDO71_00260 [Bacteroidota bacterium]